MSPFYRSRSVKLRYTFVVGMCAFISAHSQQLLNGNFENNTSGPQCRTNLPNETFTSYMKDCYAFGGGNELDIQMDNGNYGKAYEGKYFISLATPFNKGDGFSMTLSAPLVKGKTYEITYMEQASTMFSNGRDSLVFGISTDSASPGHRIYASLPEQNGVWEKVKIKFVAPNNGKYLTVRNQGLGRAWNFIDDVKMINVKQDFILVPDPVGSNFFIQKRGIDEITIKNGSERIVFHSNYPAVSEAHIAISDFESAELYITVRCGNLIKTTTIRKNNGSFFLVEE